MDKLQEIRKKTLELRVYASRFEGSLTGDMFQMAVHTLESILSELDAVNRETEKWKREALQQYPTPDAYDAVCVALNRHKTQLTAVKDERESLQQQLDAVKQENERLQSDIGVISHVGEKSAIVIEALKQQLKQTTEALYKYADMTVVDEEGRPHDVGMVAREVLPLLIRGEVGNPLKG